VPRARQVHGAARVPARRARVLREALGVVIDPRTPVIVGAAQLAPAERDADGPIALAVQALRLAGADSGAGDKLLERADAVGHVATVCWPYTDEAALIATELGIRPRQRIRTAQFGGDGPGLLLAHTARGIAEGAIDIALLSGAEAMATLRNSQRGGGMPDWPGQDSSATPTTLLGTDRPGSSEAEMAVGLIAPVYDYALLETAVQARDGTTREVHAQAIGELWSRFSEVAVGNPHAVIRRAAGAHDLITAAPDNRPVSFPYTKLLTANIGVDQATGLIMCSAQAASDAGVPRDRWVFPLAVGRAHDEWFVSERQELASSPAIRAAGAAALGHAGLDIDDLAYVDLYSCFPSAVQIAAAELGLDPASRELTLTGGLTFAGGPGNNYSSHAIATLVERLRADPDASGLATALGWYVTKHAVAVLSGRPPERPFRELEVEPERAEKRQARADHTGTATVEAYTVAYAHDGTPEAAIVAARAPDGARALARCNESDLIQAILEHDPLGRPASISNGNLDNLD
jgi:acetyl-CoA C-acetyltransferase